MFKKWLIGFILLYLVANLLIYFFQAKILFQNTQLSQDYAFQFEGTYKEKFQKMPDGTLINSLYFSVPNAKGTIMYNHGNRRDISRWGRNAATFTTRAYNVYFYDYRGFGKSGGQPTEEHLLADGLYLYDSLTKVHTEKKLLLYGRSLGTGVATYIAAKRNPKLLLLETPYDNLINVAKSVLPIFPYSILFKHRFQTDKRINKVRAPIHIFHGTADELVPYEASLKLAQILALPKDSLITTIPGGKHRGLQRSEKYQSKLDELLK